MNNSRNPQSERDVPESVTSHYRAAHAPSYDPRNAGSNLGMTRMTKSRPGMSDPVYLTEIAEEPSDSLGI